MKIFEITITNINSINAEVVNAMYDTNKLNQQVLYPPAGISADQWKKN
jgi:hypothetical protein